MSLKQLKPFIPRLLWVAARRSKTYVDRLLVWKSVKRHISGATAADQEVIGRSARKAILGSLKKLDDWLDPLLIQDAAVTVRDVGQFVVRANTDDFYHLLPSREPAILRAVEQLTEGDLFVDAGANIGFYTVAGSKRVGPTGRVIAIEMMPDTAEILRRHLALNLCSNVEVVERALSDRGEQHVEATVQAGKFGQASIARQFAPSRDSMSTIAVPTVTLDEIFAGQSSPIALIKLDLEGAEFAALQGAVQTLGRTRRVIFEALNEVAEIRELLDASGFRLHPLDSNNWLAERS